MGSLEKRLRHSEGNDLLGIDQLTHLFHQPSLTIRPPEQKSSVDAMRDDGFIIVS
jgi:hypothetical protein